MRRGTCPRCGRGNGRYRDGVCAACETRDEAAAERAWRVEDGICPDCESDIQLCECEEANHA